MCEVRRRTKESAGKCSPCGRVEGVETPSDESWRES